MQIKKHVGIFENAVNADDCEKIIEFFNFWAQRKFTHPRPDKGVANDEQLVINTENPEQIDYASA